MALYKNCGESRGVTRYQHTNGNILRHNIIRGQGGMRFGDMTLTMSYLLSLPGVETLSKPGVGVWIDLLRRFLDGAHRFYRFRHHIP